MQADLIKAVDEQGDESQRGARKKLDIINDSAIKKQDDSEEDEEEEEDAESLKKMLDVEAEDLHDA